MNYDQNIYEDMDVGSGIVIHYKNLEIKTTRDGSEDRRTNCSSGGQGFNSKHQHGS